MCLQVSGLSCRHTTCRAAGCSRTAPCCRMRRACMAFMRRSSQTDAWPSPCTAITMQRCQDSEGKPQFFACRDHRVRSKMSWRWPHVHCNECRVAHALSSNSRRCPAAGKNEQLMKTSRIAGAVTGWDWRRPPHARGGAVAAAVDHGGAAAAPAGGARPQRQPHAARRGGRARRGAGGCAGTGSE